ncbi:phage tail protein [Luteibacter sp. NPDC031894]|uniref:phage tail protein n=1 Tax=Luteibacter sp. NPDC031894 TaxID=3390572 RepID=UPI003D08EB16
MKKLQSFRTALLTASEDLTRNPEKTSIFADNGRVVAGGAPGKGFEYHYQAIAIIQEFAGDVDAVSAAILGWMAAELPGVLMNPEKADKAFRFEVEVLNGEQCDLQITVEVEEPVVPADDGSFTHPAAPLLDLTGDWQWPVTS